MSRIGDKSGSKSRLNRGKGKPYGVKAVRNDKLAKARANAEHATALARKKDGT